MTSATEKAAREWAHNKSSYLTLCYLEVPILDEGHSQHCDLMAEGYLAGHAAALEGLPDGCLNFIWHGHGRWPCKTPGPPTKKSKANDEPMNDREKAAREWASKETK